MFPLGTEDFGDHWWILKDFAAALFAFSQLQFENWQNIFHV